MNKLLDSHHLFLSPFTSNPVLPFFSLMDNTGCSCMKRLFFCGYVEENVNVKREGFDHLYWKDLPDEARAAAEQLGFNESSWDKDVYPSIFQAPVEEWSSAQQDAVKFLKLEEHATLINASQQSTNNQPGGPEKAELNNIRKSHLTVYKPVSYTHLRAHET